MCFDGDSAVGLRHNKFDIDRKCEITIAVLRDGVRVKEKKNEKRTISIIPPAVSLT